MKHALASERTTCACPAGTTGLLCYSVPTPFGLQPFAIPAPPGGAWPARLNIPVEVMTDLWAQLTAAERASP